MKLLFICNEYPPHKHGGIGTFTRDIAEGLTKEGHDVTVLGLYSTISKFVEEEINEVKVIRHPYTQVIARFNHLNFVFKLNLILRRYLQLHKFDIVECQEWQGLFPFGLNHLGYVVRLHGATVFFDTLLKRPGNRLTHFLEKMTIKNAPNIIAVSDYCGRETLSIVGLQRKYTVIYNAVDVKKLSKFRNSSFNQFKIVFANSVLPKKGVFELAKAFNIIYKNNPKATLIIIGKLGHSENNVNIKELIENLLNENAKEHVIITGWLERHDDVYEYLSKAHICCYPSHMEGFGIAPVEAMAMGKPVLFMSNGPGPEVIEDGISGILADGTNSQDIADKIESLFRGDLDIERISEQAYKRAVALFDLDSVFIPKNIHYYQNIIRGED
jgi:glycosyltransferase involved in cell wall biosynthesis